MQRPSRVAAFLIRVLLPAALVAALLGIQFSDPQFRARLRDNSFDRMQARFPRPYPDELPLRVVAIDDASLASLGQWPWPRTVLAGIVDRLAQMGARVVVFDIVLAEADRTSPEQVAASMAQRPALHAQLMRLPPHDEQLATSFARLPVVLGFPLDTRASASAPPAKARFLSFGGDARDWLPRYGGGLSNLPGLTAAAAGGGAISLSPDSDGVLRAMPLVYRVQDTLHPGLALEALRLYRGGGNLTLQVAAADAAGPTRTPGIQGVGVGDDDMLPTAPDARVWLHFRPYAAERYLSAQDLLAGKIDARQVRDHIVFVGATAKGLGDTVFSPFGEALPGIEGHVQLTEQLLAGATLLRPTWENDLVTALLLGAWLALGLLLSRGRTAWAVWLTAAALIGIFALSVWLFLARSLLLDPVFPMLAVGALFVVMTIPRHLQSEWEQRWIRHAFARYVSPNRVKHLQAHPQELELGAVQRECSFVLTDLEGFTALMEQHPPAVISGLLNDYLEGMIQIAFRHDGTLDRIVGDAVAVMFSAPLLQADHAERALACALEMDRFAAEFSSRWQAQGIPFGRTRIGVNTGTVLVGNFGGKSMLDYRALGDPINVAARLEALNAQLGSRICVSGTTVAQCANFCGRPVGDPVLKGKREPIAAFEPLAAEVAATPRIAAYLEAYALMAAEAPAAAAAFRRLAESYPDDPVAAYHAKRLAAGAHGTRLDLARK